MFLRYPTARLFLYNLIFEQAQNCVSAMVNGAYEFGLVSAGALEGLTLPIDSLVCGSMFAAKKVLEKYVEEHSLRHEGLDLPHTVEHIWQGIERDIDNYKVYTHLQHERHGGAPPDRLECSSMAPIVFDILLQHLPRY